MKSYIRERPPGWSKKPDQPVIVLTTEEEKIVRDILYPFSDFRWKVRRRADQILGRNAFASRVDICSATGEVIRTVERERAVASEIAHEEAPDDGRQASARSVAPPPPPSQDIVETGSKRRGRPSGKRSDPNFTQITAYIRKDTLKAVKLKLLRQDEDKDMSELIETLLSQWYARP